MDTVKEGPTAGPVTQLSSTLTHTHTRVKTAQSTVEGATANEEHTNDEQK